MCGKEHRLCHFFTLPGMQNSSKWAKFHQNPSTVGHNPTGMRETNYRLPPQATPNAFMNQSGNQPAQPSQNIDLRQRLEQRKRIDSHQGHHDDSSGKRFSSKNHNDFRFVMIRMGAKLIRRILLIINHSR